MGLEYCGGEMCEKKVAKVDGNTYDLGYSVQVWGIWIQGGKGLIADCTIDTLKGRRKNTNKWGASTCNLDSTSRKRLLSYSRSWKCDVVFIRPGWSVRISTGGFGTRRASRYVINQPLLEVEVVLCIQNQRLLIHNCSKSLDVLFQLSSWWTYFRYFQEPPGKVNGVSNIWNIPLRHIAVILGRNRQVLHRLVVWVVCITRRPSGQ